MEGGADVGQVDLDLIGDVRQISDGIHQLHRLRVRVVIDLARSAVVLVDPATEKKTVVELIKYGDFL